MKGEKTAELHETVRRHLAEREIRYTSGRRSVVTTLVRVDGPESAADLHRRMDVPLSSLYRSLTVLDEAGILERHHDADGLARFELAEWLTGHHHHLVCVSCGSVSDIDIPPSKEDSVRRLVSDIAALGSFQATDHALEIEGRCVRCA